MVGRELPLRKDDRGGTTAGTTGIASGFLTRIKIGGFPNPPFPYSHSIDANSKNRSSRDVSCYHVCLVSPRPRFARINRESVIDSGRKEWLHFPAKTPSFGAIPATIPRFPRSNGCRWHKKRQFPPNQWPDYPRWPSYGTRNGADPIPHERRNLAPLPNLTIPRSGRMRSSAVSRTQQKASKEIRVRGITTSTFLSETRFTILETAEPLKLVS